MPLRRWKNVTWSTISQGDLETEQEQCRDEGRDISPVEAEFLALSTLDIAEDAVQARAEALLDTIQTLPYITGSPFVEPSDLAGIHAELASPPALPARALTPEELYNKALGGWQGRACGCLLGKPVEGRRKAQIEEYLRAQQRWPLDAFFSLDAPAELIAAMGWTNADPSLFEGGITRMPEDDDTNYTVCGLAILKEKGMEFTPDDVAGFWMSRIPYFCLCTAERIAYRNFVTTVAPPDSASYRNVYREWIGAQIRADCFGYVNPGNPRRAAEFAWRDASISHIKNGIYGEMWVAAMLAAAYVCEEVAGVIRAGLAQIPPCSRFHAAIEHILALHQSGISYDEAIADVRARWDESKGHHWCHTISNAEIVAVALLWGEQDYGRSICLAVMPGFDTDCNGATVGSVLGVLLGAERLPSRWIAPLHDTLLTGVSGYHTVSLTQMARDTVALMGK